MLEFLGSLLLFFMNLYIIGSIAFCVWVYFNFFRE